MTTATTLVPLESNPDAFNAYLRQLGVSAAAGLQFVDVYGLSDEMLSMVPRPVYAVLLVYPITAADEKATAAATSTVTAEQQRDSAAFCAQHEVVFMKQTVGNMCGTVAMLHALLNNLPVLGPLDARGCLAELVAQLRANDDDGGASSNANNNADKDSSVDASAAATGASVSEASSGKLRSADELARLIETNEALLRAHSDVATSSLNANNDAVDMNTMLHFVCYVRAGGRCVELDGRLPAPRLYDACANDDNNDDAFLRAVAAAIRVKMAQAPNSYEFNVMALCGGADGSA